MADRGFASAANRAHLTRGGGHYIHAEKLRATKAEAAAALARPGRDRIVAGNLRVKEVQVAPGGHRTATPVRAPSGSWFATTPNRPSGTQPSGTPPSETPPSGTGWSPTCSN